MATVFKFNIIKESNEPEGELALLFKDIYIVLVNRFIHIAFIPSVNRIDSDFPFQLPDNIDSIASIEEAKKCTLLLNECAVTNSNELAGTVEILSVDVGNDGKSKLKKIPLLYLSNEKFEMVMKEIKQLKEELFSIHSYKTSSEIEGFQLYQTIVSLVPYFNEKQKKILDKNVDWK